MPNALKFSNPVTSAKVKIEVKPNSVNISIVDEGPSLSKEDQLILFEQNKTLTPKPTGNESSTGLGLSITKKYIELIGGSISCEIHLGKGSVFKITIPKVRKTKAFNAI